MKKTLFLSAILGAALCSSAFGAVTNITMPGWNAFDGATQTVTVGAGTTETWKASQNWNSEWSVVFSVDASTIGSTEALTLAGILLQSGNGTPGYAEGAKMNGNTTAQLTSWTTANKDAAIDLSGVTNVTFVMSRASDGTISVTAYNTNSDFTEALATASQGSQSFTGYTMAGATFGGQGSYTKFNNGANKVAFAADADVGSYTITKAGYKLGGALTAEELVAYAEATPDTVLSWKGGEGDASVLSNGCTNWLQDGESNEATSTLHFGATPASKTVNVNSAVSAGKVFVADDYTFHMGEEGSLSAAINVNSGKVLTVDSVGASQTWSQAVSGEGTLKYTGSTQMLYTGNLASSATLEGVMTDGVSNVKFNRNFGAGTGTLKNVTIEGADAATTTASVTLDGVRGYFAKNGNVRNINLVGNGMTLTNGWADQGFTIENLTGSGQLARDASKYASHQQITVNNASGWTGTYKNGATTTTLTLNSNMGSGSKIENDGTLTLNLNRGTSYGQITGYANSTTNVTITNTSANVTVNQIIQDGNQNTTGRINVVLNNADHKTTISNWMTVNDLTLKSNTSLHLNNHTINRMIVEAGNSTVTGSAGVGSNQHTLREVVLNEDANLTFGQANATISTVTLSANSSLTLGDGENHNYNLTTTTLTVNGESNINANLVIANQGTVAFTSGTVTLGCSVKFGEGSTVSLGTAYNEALEANGHVLLFQGVDEIIGDLSTVAVTGDFVGGKLYSVEQQDGSYNIYATPEPATATLSLLALAGLMARRKRH